MRILVIGPGALGIVTAMRLHEAGHDVHVAVRDKSKAERLNRSGFTMTDPEGQQHHAKLQCVWEPGKSRRYELMIHTTKLQVAEQVLRAWMPALDGGGWVVPFQNGVHGNELQKVAGGRLIECSVYWPATLIEEGHSHHTGLGDNVIGPWPERTPTQEVERIGQILSAVARTRISGMMKGVKWSKLAINAAMTSCGVVSGATLGEMIDHKPSRQAFIAVIRETLAVMRKAKIPVVRIGSSRPDVLAKLPDGLAKMLLRGAAKKYGNSRSSSQQSLARGEKTEVDFLNGFVVKHGERLGVPTPVNQAVVRTVHAIEAGKIEPGLESVESMMAELEVTNL